MHYQGGKSRVARELAQTIQMTSGVGGGGTFVSLFCGACSVECRLTGFDRVVCNDIHPYLIAMFRALQNGWDPPSVVTEEEYRYIREHVDENPALSGFVGFGCSFGGRWFMGYARAKKSPRGYAREARDSLQRQLPALKRMEFLCSDYRDVAVPDGATVYADPPYAGVKGYRDGIDHDEFWEHMRRLRARGCKVFISEMSAPEDFTEIWSKPLRRNLDVNKSNNFMITEKLYTLL